MKTRKTERRERLALYVYKASLPSFLPQKGELLKEALALEAARPLHGKSKELGAESFFGDSHKQGSSFT